MKKPIFEALQKVGHFQVTKGQIVTFKDGTTGVISETKLLTRKDFAVPVDMPYSPFIPKSIIKIV